MTRPRNKKCNYLLDDIRIFINHCRDNQTRRLLVDVRNLLWVYRDENSRYRERIKTLKEVIRLIGDKTNDWYM